MPEPDTHARRYDDPDRHHRRSLRLPGYDYAATGAYFVTLCTHQRACLFGDVIDGLMALNDLGTRVAASWQAILDHAPGIALDAWVVMPNHLHGILVIASSIDGRQSVGAQFIAPGSPTTNAQASQAAPPAVNRTTASPTLGSIVRAFKARVTVAVNHDQGTSGMPIWQRNYYEHIIRDTTDLDRIRRYIDGNPARWSDDPDNPSHARGRR
jgi:REP element-mobilizing transposase RayT